MTRAGSYGKKQSRRKLLLPDLVRMHSKELHITNLSRCETDDLSQVNMLVQAMMQRDALQKRFKVFILLSSFILVMEIVGGIFANSLALISDAGHVLTDVSALLLAYFAIRLSKKSSTRRYTFGYYRAEILAAVVNGIVIVFLTLYIFYESYIRFLSPEKVMGPEMLIISVIGFLANLYVAVRMRGYESQNLNVRGAYLHVLSDTLSSVGVIIVAMMIIATGNFVFDPIISVMIGIIILVGSFRLIRDSTRILMEATPPNINLVRLSKDIQRIKNVIGVHDLHVWSLSSDVYSLSSHILIEAKNAKLVNKIISEINEMLKSKYKITHTVIQSECESCVEGENRHRH